MDVGTMVITSRDFHEHGGARLWDDRQEKTSLMFTVNEVGFIVEVGGDGRYAKVVTSSGNTGWVLANLLIPVQSCRSK